MFVHALKINESKCIGCMRCMKACPTEAIRITGGKAYIQEHRCIDCGKCHEACPVKAIYINQDDFEMVHQFPHSVALIPAVFLGQFPEEIRVSRIYNALEDLGFRHVFEVESAANIFAEAKERYAREELQNRGIPREEIGLFYVTPCAAKIAAVKAPVGEKRSIIDGVINMDSLFNRTYRKIKEQGKNYIPKQSRTINLSSDAILSTLNNGERRICLAKKSYAIDGLKNVMDFLDKLENDEVEDVEFLELRACDQSCAGALLSYENRFLSSARMYARARKAAERERNGEVPREREMDKLKDYLIDNSRVEAPQPRSMFVLDKDRSKAFEKMERINRLKARLPQIDCGLCGAPTCESFAGDVVINRIGLSRCIFYQRHLERKDDITRQECLAAMNAVWGDDRMKEE